jgi:hypothetical protein
MGNVEETGGRGGGSFDNTGSGGEGLSEDLLDAATAPGQTGSGGPTDAGDLGRIGSGVGDLSDRDASTEGLDRDGGTATMGTDIGQNSG